MYKIYCDMDGVLTDFERKLRENGYPDFEPSWSDEKTWAAVESIDKFWEELPWMEDGKKLWNFLKPYRPDLLSAPSRHDTRSIKGKQEWVEREIGRVTLILIRAKDKCLYANTCSILIDDSKKNIDRWVEAGGVGILHKSAENTMITIANLIGVEEEDGSRGN